MPLAGQKASQTKNVKRSLDKAEGKASPKTGAAAHSREKHAEVSPADLKARILKDKKSVVSTFKTKGDQDKALAEALKSDAGQALLKKMRAMKSGREKLVASISGTFACKVAYPYTRVDGKKDSFTCDGKVRQVTAVFDVKDGKPQPQTVYPSDFHLT